MRSPSGLVLLVLLQGCLLEGAGGRVDGVDGGDGIDARVPMIDAEPRDAATPPIDAPAEPVDTGVIESDAGADCTTADDRCTGDGLVRCVAGALVSETCDEDEHCESAGSPTCVANVCVPGSTRCAEDDTVAMRCDAIGTAETRGVCPRGCADGECRGETTCSATIDATMSAGTMTFDLCAAGADTTHTLTNGCPLYDDQGALGEEVIIRLEVPRRSRIRFQVAQTASTGTVDPTVYLRSDCGDMASEIWCREDTDGQDEDFIEDLDAGDYFFVVDRHERSSSACGSVSVTITPTPL